MYSAEITLPKDVTIPSVNNLYRTSRSGHTYKVESVVDFQSALEALLVSTALADLASKVTLEPIPRIALDLQFRFWKRLWVKDVSNMIKIVEDSCKRVTLIDDSLYSAVSGEKVFNKAPQEEIIIRYLITVP